jgi:hypothetical protein
MQKESKSAWNKILHFMQILNEKPKVPFYSDLSSSEDSQIVSSKQAYIDIEHLV